MISLNNSLLINWLTNLCCHLCFAQREKRNKKEANTQPDIVRVSKIMTVSASIAIVHWKFFENLNFRLIEQILPFGFSKIFLGQALTCQWAMTFLKSLKKQSNIPLNDASFVALSSNFLNTRGKASLQIFIENNPELFFKAKRPQDTTFGSNTLLRRYWGGYNHVEVHSLLSTKSRSMCLHLSMQGVQGMQPSIPPHPHPPLKGIHFT